jgi:N-acylglucosamine 2-epimerase
MAASDAALLEHYRRHLVDDVLGWWLRVGPDDEQGGVLTCWSNDGLRLLSDDKYTWSQGRWAWLMARTAGLARRGLLDLDADRCLERAVRTAIFLRDKALLGDGATAYVTDRAGVPKEAIPGGGFHTSIFADLFAALGFAGVAAATGDGGWGALADEILAAADRRIKAGPVPTEPYPIRAGFQAFSLPMILVGVGTEVHRATGSAASAATVVQAVRRMERLFVQGDRVVELAPDDRADADTFLARHRTPGHVLEACWFLLDAADALPADRRPASPLLDAARLADIAGHAFSLGWDEAHGGLLRHVDRDGGEPRGRRTDDRYEALVASTWDTKLWWPNAEALYSLLRLGQRAGRPDLLDAHRRVHDYVMATFPAGPGQEWIQIRDRLGRPLEATVALPVKDPFHVARSLLLLVELLA